MGLRRTADGFRAFSHERAHPFHHYSSLAYDLPPYTPRVKADWPYQRFLGSFGVDYIIPLVALCRVASWLNRLYAPIRTRGLP